MGSADIQTSVVLGSHNKQVFLMMAFGVHPLCMCIFFIMLIFQVSICFIQAILVARSLHLSILYARLCHAMRKDRTENCEMASPITWCCLVDRALFKCSVHLCARGRGHSTVIRLPGARCWLFQPIPPSAKQQQSHSDC